MQDTIEAAKIPELLKAPKRSHYSLEVMLVCTQWLQRGVGLR
ncbi:hypothetical protein [Rhodoferax sp. GW822-FHT02A01]